MTATDIARPRFARMYMRSAASAEERGVTYNRRRLLQGLSGTVVEIGAGHGLNFPLYPHELTEVIAIEPEPTLRSQAETAAKSATVPIRVRAGVADGLPLEDASVDAAVASLVLCSSPISSAPSPKSDGCCAPTVNCASTSTWSRAANRSGCCYRQSIAADSGPRSPAAATQPVTPRRRS